MGSLPLAQLYLDVLAQRARAQSESSTDAQKVCFASLPARAVFCLADFEAHAEKTLCKSSLNYFSCGTDDEDTLRWNAEGFYRSAYIWVPPIIHLGSYYQEPMRPRAEGS